MDCGSEGDLDAEMLDLDSPTSSQSSQRIHLSAASEKVIHFIDNAFEHVYTELDKYESDDVYVELQRSRSTKKKMTCRRIRYYWPGDTAEEAWRFTLACVLAVLHEIKKAITSGIIVTKRDIFYRQPELFKSQVTVDRWVDDVALSCGVSRRDLMTGSQKGLICGLSDIDRVQSIGLDFDNIRAQDVEHLRWILIIEKEASFNTLVEMGFDQSQSLGPGLLVTGKGYPDLQTRFFVRHILDLAPSARQVKLFGLFDGDPDGLEIHRCYHSGSETLAHETACTLPEMIWLGVDICECLEQPEVLRHAMAMTPRDRARAKAMLGRHGYDDQVVRMLRTMLVLGIKMEIQGFEKIDVGIKQWLQHKMSTY